MSYKDTIFFKGNKDVFVDFQAEEISSEGGLVLLKKGLKGQRRQSYKSTCPKKKSTSTLLAHISTRQVLGKSHKTVIQKSRVLAKG